MTRACRPAFSDVPVPGDPYFDNAGYIGAFGQVSASALSAGTLAACDQLWLAPWSFTYRSGVMKTYLAGDVNGTGNINLSDIIGLVNIVFKGATAPDPVCRGNANGVLPINLTDVIYLVNLVFKAGPKPVRSDCCI